MANNRMYLVHKPSGMKIRLGKRMASAPYYDPPDKEALQTFFDQAFEWNPWPGHDVFEIEYESEPNWERG